MLNALRNPEWSRKYRTLFFALLAASSIHIHAQTGAIQTNVPALKTVYAHHFYIGCLLSYKYIGFPDDPPVTGQSPIITPNGGYLIQFHMNSMTPGNNMKAENIVDINASASAYNAASAADKDSIDTHPVVRFNGDMIAQLNWAKRQGFTFRGHTLIWYAQTPGPPFFRSGYTSTGTPLSKEKMIVRMDHYIKEVIRLIHEGWPGLLSAMDVVNEAVNDDTGTDRTNSEWYDAFGDNSYIMKAFESARKYTVQYGETQMKLYYNDCNTDNSNKADGIVRICTPIYQAGYLDGIGLQGHESVDRPTSEAWIASYNKFYPICSEMAITESYVLIGTTNPSADDYTRQANKYAQMLKLYLDRSYFSGRGKIINLSQNGLNDQYALANTFSSLWDSNNQCKPAFYAVANVGIHYNALDSLLACADTLNQSDYTADSWAAFEAASTSARNAMARNYSVSESAADALGAGETALKSAIDGLVKTSSDVQKAGGSIPKTFQLDQNYPNPFNPNTQIEYSVPVTGHVSLKVFKMTGQEVATLFDGVRHAGNYVATFDGTVLASGVYFYQLKSGSVSITKKFALIK